MLMPNPSAIERVVMRRVHTLRFIRPLMSTGALVMLVFVAALWGIGREVWVAHVFKNAPETGDMLALGRFYLAAFEHTRVVVQLLALTTLAALIYLARETARTLGSILVPVRA